MAIKSSLTGCFPAYCEMEIEITFSRVHEYCYTKELSISSKVDRNCHAHL